MGSRQKIAWSDGICNNANSLPECKKNSVSDIQKVQIFLGKHAPAPTTKVIVPN